MHANKETLTALVTALTLLTLAPPAKTVQPGAATDPCASPANPIVAENCRTGNPPGEWDIIGAGDTSIQGFAIAISASKGEVVHFKITSAASFHLDIYRLGYYAGNGARKVARVPEDPTQEIQPQDQPRCRAHPTGLIDCGNWSVSASWKVPDTLTSGIYVAKLVRSDNLGTSHIVFVVRDDDGRSDLLFQTSDPTWQAYNSYGGRSLYPNPRDPESLPRPCRPKDSPRAYKVSYNRPFNTRACNAPDWLFNAEYPMVRWLEANGYDVSYFTGVDSDRIGAKILEHKVFLSVGHDEYWSGPQRAHVEAARAAGVHLAFFSGNAVFWKTRWENNFRTLVTYKETLDGAPLNHSAVWTGTWRDPRCNRPNECNRPENALTGTIFTTLFSACGMQKDAITVPDAEGKMRFWRHTSIAMLTPGQTATLPPAVLGHEWDGDLDNGFRPAGLIRLSSVTLHDKPIVQDQGATFARGTASHHLTLYRHRSGALVFSAGTVQWSWGLDSRHDCDCSAGQVCPGPERDVRMQQATVNLFADMGVQPATLQSGLVAATRSTDTIAPTSTISVPRSGSSVPLGSPLIISGTAADSGGGIIGAVEVSVDGGTTWHPADGRASWRYRWTPGPVGSVKVMSRAVDDNLNLERASAGVTITVTARP